MQCGDAVVGLRSRLARWDYAGIKHIVGSERLQCVWRIKGAVSLRTTVSSRKQTTTMEIADSDLLHHGPGGRVTVDRRVAVGGMAQIAGHMVPLALAASQQGLPCSHTPENNCRKDEGELAIGIRRPGGASHGVHREEIGGQAGIHGKV